jgi:hypothetical protein
MADTQCLCGAVTLSVAGAPFAQFYCHCRDCQRAHGAAYVGEALYPAAAVAVSGPTITFQVRETPRVACARCGMRLFAELDAIQMRGVSAAMLAPGAFVPTLHINCESAVAPVRDALLHYATRPADFGGDDLRVAW